MAPVLAVAASVIGDLLGERLGAVAGLGEDLDRGGDLFDLRVFELLAGPVGGEGGVRDEGEEVGRVAGRRGLGGERLRASGSCGRGSEVAEVDGDDSPLPSSPGLAALGDGPLGGVVGWLVCLGGFALADPVLGFAVGEDLAEVAPDRGRVSSAPGSRWRSHCSVAGEIASRSHLPWRRIDWTCRACGPIGSTTASSDVYR